MDVNGQSASAHTHKNTCRTGSKTHSIEHWSTQSVGAERRGNLKSCPLNYGHLLTLNTVCLSAGSHSSPISPPPHWSRQALRKKNHYRKIYLNRFLISHLNKLNSNCIPQNRLVEEWICVGDTYFFDRGYANSYYAIETLIGYSVKFSWTFLCFI